MRLETDCVAVCTGRHWGPSLVTSRSLFCSQCFLMCVTNCICISDPAAEVRAWTQVRSQLFHLLCVRARHLSLLRLFHLYKEDMTVPACRSLWGLSNLKGCCPHPCTMSSVQMLSFQEHTGHTSSSLSAQIPHFPLDTAPPCRPAGQRLTP